MNNIKKILLDLIFPRRCLGCNILLGAETDSYICRSCLKTIIFTKGFACAFCQSPVRSGRTCVYCIKNHFLDKLLAAVSYEDPRVEKIMKTIKYRFVKSLAHDIADLMFKYLGKKTKWLLTADSITIIPVPLARRRLNWRGFNQAEAIAQQISELSGWPVVTTAVKRIRVRKPQADMPDKQSRIENMENTFACTEQLSLNGKTILLIDDVSTTGSTLDDCARALKSAGAKEIIGFVFARGQVRACSRKFTV